LVPKRQEADEGCKRVVQAWHGWRFSCG
jgi:hypothetical protein